MGIYSQLEHNHQVITASILRLAEKPGLISDSDLEGLLSSSRQNIKRIREMNSQEHNPDYLELEGRMYRNHAELTCEAFKRSSHPGPPYLDRAEGAYDLYFDASDRMSASDQQYAGCCLFSAGILAHQVVNQFRSTSFSREMTNWLIKEYKAFMSSVDLFRDVDSHQGSRAAYHAGIAALRLSTRTKQPKWTKRQAKAFKLGLQLSENWEGEDKENFIRETHKKLTMLVSFIDSRKLRTDNYRVRKS
ncbi:MAG: hypothetical protein ABIH34_04235 [Nanoarchaeota archaeon]